MSQNYIYYLCIRCVVLFCSSLFQCIFALLNFCISAWQVCIVSKLKWESAYIYAGCVTISITNTKSMQHFYKKKQAWTKTVSWNLFPAQFFVLFTKKNNFQSKTQTQYLNAFSKTKTPLAVTLVCGRSQLFLKSSFK